MERSYFSKSIQEFHEKANESILFELVQASEGSSLLESQKMAWEVQISLLKKQLPKALSGRVIFEYTIPRVGKRVDVLLVLSNAIFVIEFKVNAGSFFGADKDQTIDYALDLKNFHETSHSCLLVPILVATNAPEQTFELSVNEDNVSNILLSNGQNLTEIIKKTTYSYSAATTPIDVLDWEHGRYKPTPTIIEAARALYEGHSVHEISRSEAGAQNLSLTSNYVSELTSRAQKNDEKIICFITGVPGSGKTLAGLNIATSALQASENRDGAVFLSGNKPLVDVLQEALARNQVEQAKEKGARLSKTDALRSARTFVQIIHRWRDNYLIDETAPEGRIVVFDEAQRAWTKEQTSSFMRQKKGQANFSMSEPEYLLSVMERHSGWCAVVCLIGGGQEINKGEAGIDEWLLAASNSNANWKIFVSDRLSSADVFEGLPKLPSNSLKDSRLHLSTSIRSFRAEALSDFVSALLDGNIEAARSLKSQLSNYPIFLSRDIDEVRAWLRKKARGTERFGLVASSNAIRLKSEGLHVKNSIEPQNWFLNEKEDVRSSFALEDVATEFDIQGLELDWVGVCWDANLVWDQANWSIRRFSGTTWKSVNDEDRLKYILNSYRVLLTRARQGLAIFVPRGSDEDPTRDPVLYDNTYRYICSCVN